MHDAVHAATLDIIALALPVDTPGVLDNAPAPAQPPVHDPHASPAFPPAPAVPLPCPSPVCIGAWLPACQR